MTPQTTRDGVAARILAGIQDTTTYTLLSLALVLPAIWTVGHTLGRQAAGFALIGWGALATSAMVKRIDPEQARHIPIEALDARERWVLLGLLLPATVVSQSVTVGLGALAGVVAMALGPSPIVAIACASLFPLIDRRMATACWYASPSGVASMATIAGLLYAVRELDTLSDGSSSQLQRQSFRYSI